nr:hypothetical protein [Gammaproteobacteria bacterium]
HRLTQDQIVCIVLHQPIQVCIDRVMNREEHPTLCSSNAVPAIIHKLADMFVAPQRSEGFLGVATARTSEQVEALWDNLTG